LATFAVWDQTPPLADATGRNHNLGRWQSLADVTSRLQRDLPPNAKVFQLPVVPFPEAGRTGGMPDYEHLLPYLTATSLHYSYGHLRTAPALRWARYVSRLAPVDMAGALEQAGFSAIWIDPRAYADGASALVDVLLASGRDEFTFPSSTLATRIIRLTPPTRTHLPDFSDLRFRDPWDDMARTPHLLALQGWDPLESDQSNRWRWARREAALGIWTDKSTTSTLRFRLGGPDRSTVILLQHGREIWRAAPGFQTRAVTVNLSAGLNTLHWRFEGKTFRPGGNDPRELGFMVENLSMSVP
ncbi:MAG TPA: hypothetical protein VHN79_05775, partial [Lacunisphaera sp.]|nr:hypothetical protein [Lacunisphaera sp.]